MKSFSEPFILRPVGTILLAIGLFLTGVVAYLSLPVASVPNIDFPVIRVFASRPGADPTVMASTVAAPLERRLGEISGINQMTSTSTLGNTSITLQFNLGRDIDRAARDVQAAINASITELPSDLPSLPRFRKANPAASPILVVALTSKTLPPSALYDVADTVLIQRISQIPGVGEVTVSGAEQPAVRVRLNPGALASAGISTETVRPAIVNANSISPLGAFEGGRQSETISTNRQMRTADEFRDIVVKNDDDGSVVRLSDIAEVGDAVRNTRSAAWFNKEPSVLLTITKQSDANVIETVDRVKALLPELKQWIPAGVDFTIFSDRTGTIRASVLDMQFTLIAAAILVMMVVFVFLRRMTPTIAAGVSVPLALAGTFAGMWVAGFSINNLSLMALVISVGFVVDDAIVMIENMYRNLEDGMSPFEAAREGREADRLHGARHQPVADRSLRAADVHGRRGRPPVPRILDHARLRDRRLDRRVAVGDADDLRPSHPPRTVRPGDVVRPGGGGRAAADRQRLRPVAARRAALPRADHAGVRGDDRCDRRALCEGPEGLFPDRRLRADHRRHARVAGRVVQRHAGAAAEGGRHRARGSGGGGDRLVAGRRRRLGRRPEPRLDVHLPEADRRARRQRHARSR